MTTTVDHRAVLEALAELVALRRDNLLSARIGRQRVSWRLEQAAWKQAEDIVNAHHAELCRGGAS